MKVLKEFGLCLKAEIEIEKSSPFDTSTESSIGRLKFIKGDDGVWVRRVGSHPNAVDKDGDDDTLALY